MSEDLQFVVITGLSGAGKSQAMDSFEDAGWFCVDNLPPQLVPTLVDLFRREGSKVDRVAVVSDVRGGEYFSRLEELLDELHERGVDYTLVFLEASNEALVRRFKETRRRHPLASGGSVIDGIRTERRLLAGAARARHPGHRHQRHLHPRAQGAPQRGPDPAHASAPTSCSPSCRSATSTASPSTPTCCSTCASCPTPTTTCACGRSPGWTPRCSEFVMRSPGTAEYLERLFPLLDFLFPRYAAEGKAHLTVGVGCTGGKHRSVAIAELVGERYAEAGLLHHRAPPRHHEGLDASRRVARAGMA